FMKLESGADVASHLRKRRANCTGERFADAAQVTVLEAVDVVGAAHAQRQTEQVLDCRDQVFPGHLAGCLFHAQLVVDAPETERAEGVAALVGKLFEGLPAGRGATATVRFPGPPDDAKRFRLAEGLPLDAVALEQRSNALFNDLLIDAHRGQNGGGADPTAL